MEAAYNLFEDVLGHDPFKDQQSMKTTGSGIV